MPPAVQGPEKRKLPIFLGHYRSLIAFFANLAVAAGAYTGAFLLRFDFSLPPFNLSTLLRTLPAVVAIQYSAFYLFKLTRGWWRYVGLADFANTLKSALAGALGLGTWVMLFERGSFYPRSIFLLYPVLVVGLSIGMRLAVRLWRQGTTDLDHGDRRRLLIIGGGDTGEALLREIRNSNRLNYQVVAFLDDDPRKRGAYINGVVVMDEVSATADVVQRFQIDEIIVATPSASGEEMRGIITNCRAAGVPFKVMPATWEVLDARRGLSALRPVDINDLLRRPPVELDLVGIGRFLKGKCVLVSGAAGSIGSELCRQILRYHPATLVCVDHDENGMFYLQRSLEAIDGDVRYELGDINDATRMDALFTSIRPHIVYHAAAHKHVPMIEANTVEGVRNNVFGTQTIATIAGRHGAEAFVLISTDKAVNPTSVMGCSKRIAELLIQNLPFTTRYTAVRFGNVLGSQGSVVPLLKEQIAKGGPLTITHPEMRRYFMTIPEAVELVIQASSMGKENEVLMLDMGEPVKIVDLARDLVTLSGLRLDTDIKIQFTGVRPGEKLHEELYLEAETADRTTHPKILVARHGRFDAPRFAASINELRQLVETGDAEGIRRLLGEIVPEFRGASPPVGQRRSIAARG
jgi:FlaA1/EpsC-like NDP-sugar epimerase